MRRDGWKIVYLGADTPLRDAIALADKLSARVLGISLSLVDRAGALEKSLDRIPEGVSVVLGGAAATRALAKRVGAVYAGAELSGAVEAVRTLAV
jgi:methanogenic corrinoid protein MtbC1